MEGKVIALVKSPSKIVSYRLREGNGFSLAEIKDAGKSVKLMKDLGIKIDYHRRTKHESNIDMLKKIKTPETKGTKKEAFVKKEKKKAAFKPKQIDKKVKKTAPKPKTPVKEKAPAIPKEKLVIKEKTPPKEKVKVEKKGMPLNVLTGLGMTTAKKFESVGINSVEELVVETPEDIAKLIKGASETKIITWIKEGKRLLEESK